MDRDYHALLWMIGYGTALVNNIFDGEKSLNTVTKNYAAD